MELMTKNERRKKRLHEKIVQRFDELQAEFPDSAKSRIAMEIANDSAMTREGIRKILIRYGRW